MSTGAPPSVSVVVPAHDAARWLPESLASVAEQTYRDFELIVVDDGSTDGTGDAAERLIADLGIERGRVVTRPRGEAPSNAGLARNAGIEAAAGEYVAFLDADDVWYPRKLERVMRDLGADRDAAGACHAESITEAGEVIRVQRYGGGPGVVPLYWRLLLNDNCLSPSATVLRRDVVRDAGGFSTDPRHHSVEDYDLWLRVARRWRIAFIDEPLGEYRRRPDSLSADLELQLSSNLNVVDDNLERAAESRSSWWWRWLGRQRRMRAIRQTARVSHRQGDPEAARLTWWAFREWPLSPKLWALGAQVAAAAIRRRWVRRGNPAGSG